MFFYLLLMSSHIKKSLLFLIFTLLSLNTQAQESFLNFGPKVGANFSTLNTNNLDASEESITGLTAGAFLEIKSTSSLSFQVELLYSEQGTNLDSNLGELKDIELNYLQAPVLLKYRLLKIFNIHGGPQLGFLTSDIKSENFEAKDFDFSGVAGVGVELGKLRADLRYHFGFTDSIEFNLPTDTSEASNKYYSVMLSYELF